MYALLDFENHTQSSTVLQKNGGRILKPEIIKDKIRNFFKEKKLNIIVVAGIAGIFLIMISGFVPKSDTNKNKADDSSVTDVFPDDSDEYKKQVENELTEILTKIKGVGNCEVMVTVEGTTEYVYAENLSEYNDSAGDKVSGKRENEIVMVEQNGEKQALVKKIIKPEIGGVVIVCDGGGDTKIRERVLTAVSTALNISSGRICVESKT